MESIRLDATRLKALAHPLRLRLLTLLRDHGPATATELARRVGDITSGTTSYHLRQLAAHGFVKDVPDKQKGRDRRWQATSPATRLNVAELLSNPATENAMQTLLQEEIDLHIEWLHAWLKAAPEYSQAWNEAATFTDRLLKLSPTSMANLTKDLNEIILRYESLPQDEETKQTTVLLYAFPRADLDVV